MDKTYEVGQIVITKKSHPCGNNSWKIIRVGMDVKIKCTKCGRIVMLTRDKFEKRLKKVVDKL